MSLYKKLSQILSFVRQYLWEAVDTTLLQLSHSFFGAKSPLTKLHCLNGVIMRDYSQICNQSD